jgi:hypothetical protein
MEELLEMVFSVGPCRAVISGTVALRDFVFSGVGLVPRYCGHFWPIVQAPDDR